MNSIKCPQCGLVNWGTPPACKRCGDSFQDVSEQAFVSASAGEQFAPSFAEETQHARKVWKWFVAYCVFMAVLYLLVALMGAGLLVVAIFAPVPKKDSAQVIGQGIAFLLVGLIFTVPYAIGPFSKGKPWGWVYGIIMIALGMTSCCLWPITIPLLIQWIKPEMKRMFGQA